MEKKYKYYDKWKLARETFQETNKHIEEIRQHLAESQKEELEQQKNPPDKGRF